MSYIFQEVFAKSAENTRKFENAIINGNVEEILQLMQDHIYCSISNIELKKFKEHGITLKLEKGAVSDHKVLSLNQLCNYPSSINVFMEMIVSGDGERFNLAEYFKDCGNLCELLFLEAIKCEKIKVLEWMYHNIGINLGVNRSNIFYAQVAIETGSIGICEFLLNKGFVFTGTNFSNANTGLKLWAHNKNLL